MTCTTCFHIHNVVPNAMTESESLYESAGFNETMMLLAAGDLHGGRVAAWYGRAMFQFGGMADRLGGGRWWNVSALQHWYRVFL